MITLNYRRLKNLTFSQISVYNLGEYLFEALLNIMESETLMVFLIQI